MKKTINIKKTILTTLVAFGCLLHNLPASVTFTGTALVGSGSPSSLFLVANQTAIWLTKDDSTTAWSTLVGSGIINYGQSLTSDSTYNSSLFTVMGSTVVNALGTTVSGGVAGVALANGITTGDQYAVLVFNTSTTTTIEGDTYKIWRASDWLIPSDSASIGYSTTPDASKYTQIKGTSFLLGSGTVAVAPIPEPSSASLLALGMAGLVALRARRKS